MARTITGPQRTQLQTRNSGNFVRILIKNGAGTFVDFSTVNSSDYRLDVTVDSTLDQVADTATVVLRAGRGTASIAPAITAATVNATTRGIDVLRDLAIETAVVAVGSTPSGGDWQRIFEGTIDTARATAGGDRLALSATNRMKPILRATFAVSTTFGDGATALQTVLQSMLTAAMGGGAPTLVVPTSPGWAPARLAVRRGDSLWGAMTQLLDQIGWLVRYRWNGNTPELRLFGPNRTPSAADFTLSSIEVRDVTSFDFDGEAIRNSIQVLYRSGGVAATWTSTDSASITAYGTQPLIIQEAATSQIDTLAEAQTMANAILADLKTPPVSHGLTTIHTFWPAEVGDVFDVPSNTVTHDATQRLAAVGVSHSFSDGGGVTTLQLRGAPASRGRTWLQLGGTTEELPSSVVARVTASTATTTTVTVTNDPPGGVVRYLGGTATRISGPLANVDSAEGTAWIFTKPTATNDAQLEALFSGTVNGLTSVDSVLIGRDTQTLLARLRLISMGATTATIRFSFTGPNSPGSGVGTIAQIQGVTISGFVEGNTFAVVAGTGDGDYSPSTKFQDFVVTRPAVGSQPGRVSMRSDVAGYNSDTATIDIVPQLPNVPARITIVSTSQGTGTGDYTINWRAFRADGVEIDYANVAWSWTRTPTTGSPVVVNGTPTRDTVNNWWTVTITRLTGDQNSMRLQTGADTATTATELVVPIPTYVAGGSTGTPRFTSTTVTVPSSGSPPLNITLEWNTADMPSGFTVGFTGFVDSVATDLRGITSGLTLTNGRTTSGTPYLSPFSLRGTLTAYDSAGNVLTARAITTTSYFGA